MNGDEKKWIKELLHQHNIDQRDYFNAKFDSLEKDIGEVKADIKDIKKNNVESIKECSSIREACRGSIEEKITTINEECKTRQEKSDKRNNKLFLAVGLVTAGTLALIEALWKVDAIAIAKTIFKLGFSDF